MRFHVGKYGGPVPDALTALCRLIATLHDDAGNVAVTGLQTGPPHTVSMDSARLRHVAGMRPQVSFLGEGALSQRIWASPAVAVLSIDAPLVADAAHKIVPLARQGQPCRIGASGPAFDAFRRACADTWGCAPIEAGSGGSLPLAAALAEAYPDMALLLTGVDDPESKAHSENESVHLGELQKCCVNEALLLGYLAAEVS